MSHVRCFFCGKDSAVSSFDPSDLDLDLYIRQVRGLGYGGGFAAGPDESVLGDDYYTPKFFDRSIAFLKLLIDKGIVAKEEIENRLKIGIQFVDSDDFLPYDDFINFCTNLKDEDFKKELKSFNVRALNRIVDETFYEIFTLCIVHQIHHRGQFGQIFKELGIKSSLGDVWPYIPDEKNIYTPN